MADEERIGLEAILDDSDFQAGLKRYASGLSDAEKRTDSAASGISRTLSSMGKGYVSLGNQVWDVAGRIGQGLAIVGGAAVAVGVAVTKSALDIAGDYQASMNVLQATTGASAAQMAQLGVLAKELGADMTLPATSAADAGIAMTEMAKAGLAVNDILGASKGVLQLSAAANISNAEAAMITVNSLKAFNLEGSKATMVADLLTAAAMSSGSSVSDMGMAFQMGAAVATQAGISIEDFTTMLAEMSQAGIKGSDAGTSIKTMLLRLTAPTDTAKQAIASLGVAIYDASGKMRNIRDIIGDMSKATINLSDEQRAEALTTIFGTDAIRAASIVIGKGTDAFDAMGKKVTQSGKASEMAAARMKGFKGVLAGLKSQAETALLAFAEPMLGPLENIGRKIADVFGSETVMASITAMGERIGAGIGNVIQFVTDALGSFSAGGLEGLGTFLGIPDSVISTIKDIFKFMSDHLPEIQGALIGIGAFLAGSAVVSALAAIGVALAAINLPLVALGAAAALLGAAWAGNWGGIRDTLTDVWTSTIQPALADLWEWLQVNLPIAIQTLSDFWSSTLQPALVAFWDFVQTSVFPMLQTLWDWLAVNVPLAVQTLAGFWSSTLLPAIKAFVDFEIGTVIPMWADLWDWLATNIPAAIRTLSKFWTDVLQPPLAEVWEFITVNVIPLFQTLWTWLAVNVPLALQTLSALWLEGWGVIRDFFVEAYGMIEPLLTALWEFLEVTLFAAIEILVSKWLEGWTLIQARLAEVWAIVQPILKILWDWIATNIPKAISSLVDLWSSGIKKIGDRLSEIWNGIILPIFNAWKAGIAGIIDGLATLIGWITDAISLMNKLTGKVNNSPVLNPPAPAPTPTTEYQEGGWVRRTEPALVHQGEFMLSRQMLAGLEAVPANILQRISPAQFTRPNQSTTIYNNRTNEINMSPQYNTVQSPASVFFDVTAALIAVEV